MEETLERQVTLTHWEGCWCVCVYLSEKVLKVLMPHYESERTWGVSVLVCVCIRVCVCMCVLGVSVRG